MCFLDSNEKHLDPYKVVFEGSLKATIAYSVHSQIPETHLLS